MKVYLDYAATTPVHPEVLKAMLPYFKDKFGNPSSVHSWGQEARMAIDRAREQVAKVLNCQVGEVYFSGTTTTSDNLAIQGVALAAKKKGRSHLVTSAIEHHAVLTTCEKLAEQGFELTVLPVDRRGSVKLSDVKRALSEKTALVSIMLANNEVGTIQPIKEIAKLAKKKGVFVHTDAAAAVDYLSLDVTKLGVDLMTIGAHKFGGPKGVGVLYVRSGVAVQPIIHGGHHEQGLWPGTENVALIVGLAKALGLSVEQRAKSAEKVARLRNKLVKGVLENVSRSQLTGHPTKRLADIASFVIRGVEGEAVLLLLDQKGIAASSGSACTSGELKPSHVLLAMGIPPEIAHGSIRFSLGKQTTAKEIDHVLNVLPEVVAKLRRMAPHL